LVYEQDELLRWRAISMFGWLAGNNPKLISKEVHRLTWSLNDEAGSIGRGAPEVIGEIARNNIELARDGVKIITHYLKDPETCRPPNRNIDILNGILWGLGRVASKHPSLVADAAPLMLSFLDDPDSRVRGHAAWSLGRMNAAAARAALHGLADDPAAVLLYEDEELRKTSVGVIAGEAIARLDATATQGEE
jgi:hypothetical protein